MQEIRKWMGWLVIIVILHGVEQLLTGLDELYELRGQIGAVLSLFPDRDSGIVVLVFIVTTLVMLFVYTSFLTSRWRFLGPFFFGVASLGEIHHVVKTVVRLDYFPGAVSAIAYVTVGFLLLRAVIREVRRT